MVYGHVVPGAKFHRLVSLPMVKLYQFKCVVKVT